MIHLEKAYDGYRSSWRTTLASLLITGVFFSALSITRTGGIRDGRSETERLSFYIPPPPESESRNQVPLPSVVEPTFQFDIEEYREPTEIPLDFLHVPLGRDLNPSIRPDFSLRSDFLAQRPQAPQALMVFDRRDVDRQVVPVYLPRSNLPYQLQEEGGELYVLYRVTDQGRTEDIHILSTTNPDLNRYAEEYIRRVRFRPAERDGKPVNIWVQHALNYSKSFSSPFQVN